MGAGGIGEGFTAKIFGTLTVVTTFVGIITGTIGGIGATGSRHTGTVFTDLPGSTGPIFIDRATGQINTLAAGTTLPGRTGTSGIVGTTGRFNTTGAGTTLGGTLTNLTADRHLADITAAGTGGIGEFGPAEIRGTGTIQTTGRSTGRRVIYTGIV